MIDSSKLTEKEFIFYVNTLSEYDLDLLLCESVDRIFGKEKVEILLEKGANANQLVEDGVMLWTVAFSRNLITFEDYTVTDLLMTYIFNLFTKEFKDQCRNELIKSLNAYNAIINKSNMYYKNLGYETKNGKNLLDQEHEQILDSFADNIEKIYESLKQ